MAHEQNAFTKVAGEDAEYFPADSPQAEEGKAFRDFQLGKVEPTPANAVKVGLPHPDSQVIPESQEEVEVIGKKSTFSTTQPLPVAPVKTIIGGEDHN